MVGNAHIAIADAIVCDVVAIDNADFSGLGDSANRFDVLCEFGG